MPRSSSCLIRLGSVKRDGGWYVSPTYTAAEYFAARYRLPLLVSVSRKSFLRAVTGRSAADAGPASLAAELYAVRQGADYIRTHAPGPLKDALLLEKALGRPS